MLKADVISKSGAYLLLQIHSQNSAIGKIRIRCVPLLGGSRPSWHQTFLLRQRDVGHHVVTSCPFQKRRHHTGIRLAAASCIRARRLTKDAAGRQVVEASCILPYSRNLLRESSGSEGLKGGSTSWRMMQSGQSAHWPLHNRLLRLGFPETRRQAANDVSGFTELHYE